MKITIKKLLMHPSSSLLIKESVSAYYPTTSSLLPCNMSNKIFFSSLILNDHFLSIVPYDAMSGQQRYTLVCSPEENLFNYNLVSWVID